MALKKEKLSSVKPKVQIKDAWVDVSLGKGYNFLWGIPIDHPNESLNGNIVHTSYIVSIKDDIVETKRSIYKVLSWDTKKLPLQLDLF